MSDRDTLIRNFLDAARPLAAEALSGLDVRKALLVNAALERGGEVILVHAMATETVIVALHPPGGSDADPVELCRIELPSSGVSN